MRSWDCVFCDFCLKLLAKGEPYKTYKLSASTVAKVQGLNDITGKLVVAISVNPDGTGESDACLRCLNRSRKRTIQ